MTGRDLPVETFERFHLRQSSKKRCSCSSTSCKRRGGSLNDYCNNPILVDMAIPTYQSLRLRLRHGVTPNRALITSVLQINQLSGFTHGYFRSSKISIRKAMNFTISRPCIGVARDLLQQLEIARLLHTSKHEQVLHCPVRCL